MNIKTIAKLVICCGIMIGASGLAAAQGSMMRSITSDDFASRRPEVSQPAAKRSAAGRPRGFTYKFVRADRNAVRHSPRKSPKGKNLSEKITELGVTMWKMRPPRASEKNLVLLPVLDDKGERKMWLAERVNPDSIFQPGDRVRFAVESSDVGYIYVIGRETYSDGSYGSPYPIFPASSRDDNSVRPGMLFDFPDQREDLPYLKLNPKNAKYTGELLTVILSPKQLTSIKIDKDGNLKNPGELADLEFGSDVEIFTRTDSADKIFTKTESESACGVKTRELVREGNACGDSSHQLTSREPLPQSIYRIKGFAGQPAVAFVKLAVRQ